MGNPDGAAVRLARHDDARLGVDTPTDDARRTLAPSRPYRDARKARPPRPRREERTAAEAAARGACCRRGLDAMQGSRAATDAAARGARCSRGRSSLKAVDARRVVRPVATRPCCAACLPFLHGLAEICASSPARHQLVRAWQLIRGDGQVRRHRRAIEAVKRGGKVLKKGSEPVCKGMVVYSTNRSVA